MLIPRIITGIILAAIVLIFLFLLPSAWFMGGTAVVILLAAWEWSALADIKRPVSRAVYLVFILCMLWFSLFLPLMLVLIIAGAWWLLALAFVVLYPRASALWRSQVVRIILGVLVLVPFWLAINVLRSYMTNGGLVVFVLFCFVWAADIGAYFAGRWWGRHKLMPNVSPGKTWQGFFGGLLLSLLVAAIALSWLKLGFDEVALIFLMAIVLNIFSVVGDLFESMLKRHCQVKDSGNILPGHGGILDRIDSLTAATPLFLLGFMLIPVILN